MGMLNLTNPIGSVAFQPPKETKEVLIDAVFPDHKVIIGSNLDAK